MWKNNSDITEKLEINQWHNTDTVLKWFNNIADKSTFGFTQFDIKEFYSSITEKILHQTIKFAKQHANINKNNLPIINHCYKPLLLTDRKTWRKKTTDNCFDITMGSFDRAEICELVGIYIQLRLEEILPKLNFGL